MIKKRIAELLSGTAGEVGGSSKKPMIIEKPLIIMFGQDDKLICHIHPREKDSYESYGLMVCDMVRHLARAFKVDEDDVWEWIDKERHHPTTEIEEPN